MPPFEYRGYQNPYVGSMSQLLQQPGQIEAARATAVANAQGQAAQASGQAWGNAVQNIGQQVAAIPQQMQQQKMQALQMQDVQAQIAERTAQAQDRQRVIETAQAGAAAMKASLRPDGTIDPEKAANLWGQTHPVAAQAYLESVQKTRQVSVQTQEAEQKLADAQKAAAQAKANHAGELGAAGLEMLGRESPINARDHGLALIADAVTNKLIDEPTAQKMVMQVAQAGPDQLKGIYQQLLDGAPAVKERMLGDAVKRSDITKNEAQAAEANVKAGAGQKPGSLDEQLLEAITKGDKAAADRITLTLKEAAAAKRDPDAAAQAAAMRALSMEAAQARLDALREAAKPVTIETGVITTASGRKYVDLNEWQTPTAREKAKEAADKAGITAVNKDTADSLRAADVARANFQTILSQLKGKLPTDASGRIIAAPTNKLSQYLQTDADMAAWGSWRTAAIQAVQALAEKGMGLRINKAEIQLMLDNDIPQITDTWQVAQQRIGNLMSLLDHKEAGLLDRDRTTMTPPAANGGSVEIVARRPVK